MPPSRKKTPARKSSKAKSPKTSGHASAAGGTDPRRVRAILDGLDAAYPDATCELRHENAWQLLIATIMSAQCTDAVVNIVTEVLFQKYPTPKELAYANPSDIEQIIRPTGFFRNKTKSIMGASKKIVEEFGGEVPRTMEQLLTVPGAARKTANVVLGTAFGIASGVVVDTHVMRLSSRLDLTKHTEPKKIELDLMKIIPQDQWIKFSHQLIWHGRRVCVARKPRCIDCNLEKICYSKDKTINTQAKRLK
ncbi:MAG TPA: endonuclease III [Candidatus Acidoferrum sp.]|nr:endonuclease III [Candidatus Acidoferrum sp.]